MTSKEKTLVGTVRFELTTPSTPCWCATRLRYAPTLAFRVKRATIVAEESGPEVRGGTWERGNGNAGTRLPADALVAEDLQDFFQFHAHLAHDLGRDADFHARLHAFQPLARAGD